MNLDHVFLWSAYERGNLRKIAAVRTDRKGRVLTAYESKIAPKRERESSEFPNLQNAILDMESVLGIGINPSVIVSEKPVIEKATFGAVFPFTEDIWLDIYQLSWPLFLNAAISKDRAFRELCAEFNVVIDSDNEVVALCNVYWAMMTRYKTSLFGEEIFRDMGGKALASVRKLLGV